MVLEIILFITLFILVGAGAGFIACLTEDRIHQEYSEPSDWPADDDWTILADFKEIEEDGRSDN